MEDAHSVHAPGTWGAPDPSASFVGVYDGHGGRGIADYLEDNLVANLAREWKFAEGEEEERSKNDAKEEEAKEDGKERRPKKPRTTGGPEKRDDENRENGADDRDADDCSDDGDDDGGRAVRTALERAFLLTDVRSRLTG